MGRTIAGLTGTLCAGKDTVVKYLVETRGFDHHSVRGFLSEELARRGLKSDRDNLVALGNELRERYGSSYIVEQLLHRAYKSRSDRVAIESIRTVGEAEHIRSQGAYLWAVDADIKVRYERSLKRASGTDFVSFETFVANEQRELANTDPNKQNIAAVMAMADTVLRNDSTLEDLFLRIERLLI